MSSETGRAGLLSGLEDVAPARASVARARRHALAVVVTVIVVSTMTVTAPASAASSGGVLGDNLTTELAAPALAAPSGVLAWGQNLEGHLGDGITIGPEVCTVREGFQATRESCSSIPVPVAGLSGIRTIAVGGNRSASHSLALLNNGTVMAWGDNFYGELGDGKSGRETYSDVPIPVSGLSGVTAIAAGSLHSLALLSNGTVMAWGVNQHGELGVGSTTGPEECEESSPCSTVPVLVPGLTGVTAIAAAGQHSLALLQNGTVMAWGKGVGELKDNDAPVPISGLSGVTAIAVSPLGRVKAILSNGSVVQGEGIQEPQPVSGLSGVTAIAASSLHSLALLSNGTVMAWGFNERGQLGDGVEVGPEKCSGRSCSRSPVPVSGLSGVTAIAAGEYDSLALLTNGTVMAWGDDSYGELGDATASGEDRDVPVPVSGLAAATAIAAAGNNSLAISSQPTVTAVDPDRDGAFTGGTRVHISGINFTGTTAVKFGSAKAGRFRVTSPTSITAVSPPGTGTVDVTVTTPAGTSPTGINDRFSYEPTVTGVEADNGPPGGGTFLRITGTNLTGATAVKFGSANATRFRTRSTNSITAVAPPGSGTVNVTVATPGGTSQISTGDQFTYAMPGEWTIFPTPSLGSGGVAFRGLTGEDEFRGVSCVSLRFCIAVGHDSTTDAEALTEDWNGVAWSPLEVPPTRNSSEGFAELSRVSCVSRKFCVAIGRGFYEAPAPDFQGYYSFIDSWNGSTWSNIDPARYMAQLDGVSCLSSSFCLAVGTRESSSVPPKTRAETWNGTTWSIIASPSPALESSLYGVSCTSITFCVAVGREHKSGSYAHPLVETWNGTEWSVVPNPGPPTGYLRSVSCVSAVYCVAVGASKFGTLVEAWNGSSWSRLQSPSPEVGAYPELSSVSCASVKSCVAVGYGSLEPGPSETLVETSKGDEWTIVPSANGVSGVTYLEGVSCLRAEPCFAVGEDQATLAGPFQTLVETDRGPSPGGFGFSRFE